MARWAAKRTPAAGKPKMPRQNRPTQYERVPAVGALPSASWVFGSLRGVVLLAGRSGLLFLRLLSPPKPGNSDSCFVQ